MRFVSAAFATLVSLSAFAASGNFCGRVDISQISNTDLMNIIFALDGRQTKRQTCGLFTGEDLPFCSSCADVDEGAMTFLRPILGKPSHLDWHVRWHKIRGESGIDDSDFAEAQRDGFIPASMTIEQFQPHFQGGKLHGEDFLFMHRMMLKMVQLELAVDGRPCIQPWQDLPASIRDQAWPVPRDLSNPDAAAKAEKSLAAFREMLASFRDPAKMVRIKTLNALGARIESVLHQNLHAFYRDQHRCSPEAEAQGYCDDLLPNETSPLNKHFWMIHGMVDSLIGVWLNTHGFAKISTDCSDQKKCYTWQGTWIGKYPR